VTTSKLQHSLQWSRKSRLALIQ